MTKTECINIFNAMVTGKSVSFQDKLLKLFSDYLAENNIKYSEKLITLVVQFPQLLQQALPKIIDYYCIKYHIRLLSDSQLNPIIYYE